MTSREAFEKVFLGGNPQTGRRNEHGDYVLPSIQAAWPGWQSACEYQKQKDAGICDAQNPQPDEYSGSDEYVAQRVTRECRNAILDQEQ